MDNVRSYSDFVLSYDRRNRVAHWVFEHLTPETVKYNPGVKRSTCEFKPDESIHPFFRYFRTILKLMCVGMLLTPIIFFSVQVFEFRL